MLPGVYSLADVFGVHSDATDAAKGNGGALANELNGVGRAKIYSSCGGQGPASPGRPWEVA